MTSISWARVDIDTYQLVLKAVFINRNDKFFLRFFLFNFILCVICLWTFNIWGNRFFLWLHFGEHNVRHFWFIFVRLFTIITFINGVFTTWFLIARCLIFLSFFILLFLFRYLMIWVWLQIEQVWEVELLVYLIILEGIEIENNSL